MKKKKTPPKKFPSGPQANYYIKKASCSEVLCNIWGGRRRGSRRERGTERKYPSAICTTLVSHIADIINPHHPSIHPTTLTQSVTQSLPHSHSHSHSLILTRVWILITPEPQKITDDAGAAGQGRGRGRGRWLQTADCRLRTADCWLTSCWLKY